jgi:hypothetical protein
MAGGEEFDLVISRPTDGGNESGKASGREIFSEGLVDVLKRGGE